MIEFGTTLRNAREAKGYTISQLAEATHIKPSAIEGLENEDFSMIAAPIYGRGFVKIYCEAVGLDPTPLVEEYMAIVNGEREVAIKERPVATEFREESDPPVAPAPAPENSSPQPEPDLFNQDEQPLPMPQPAPAPQAPAAESTPSFARFAAPMREYSGPARDYAPAYPLVNPRLAVLVSVAILIAIALIFGIRALYRATTSEKASAQEPAAAEVPAPKTTPVAAPEAKPAPRTPQEIPQLYID